jgi:hypothetical protein
MPCTQSCLLESLPSNQSGENHTVLISEPSGLTPRELLFLFCANIETLNVYVSILVKAVMMATMY